MGPLTRGVHSENQRGCRGYCVRMAPLDLLSGDLGCLGLRSASLGLMHGYRRHNRKRLGGIVSCKENVKRGPFQAFIASLEAHVPMRSYLSSIFVIARAISVILA